MPHKLEVVIFFEAVCQKKVLQDKLKPPCPATRMGFVNVAQESGYMFSAAALRDYVKLPHFYSEFQAAIEKHQSGIEELSRWLEKWQRHVRLCDDAHPDNDYHHTIRRYI